MTISNYGLKKICFYIPHQDLNQTLTTTGLDVQSDATIFLVKSLLVVECAKWLMYVLQILGTHTES